jgi:thiamine-monophosphate kinase
VSGKLDAAAVNELELIARLSRDLPGNASVVVGAGDDCAVLEVGLPDRWLLFKTDAVVEGIHFAPGTAPERIGHKALGRCLSDVAAMAGEPASALVTIGLPRQFEPAFVEGIYAGLGRLAQKYRVALVGGETTASPERLFMSVALLGTVAKGRAALRSGARAGDAIFVTGELGGSRAGKHLDFEPRLAEAGWLAAHFTLHAMIDLSDGLASDLRHVLHASHAGAELLAEAIPISRAARRPPAASSEACPGAPPAVEPPAQQPASLGEASTGPGESAKAEAPPPGVYGRKTPLLAALTDGEDFELLFTVASRDAVPLLDAWKAQFPDLRLSCIGKITAEPGVRIRDRKGIQPLAVHGYVHFAE